MRVNAELERKRKEVTVAFFKVYKFSMSRQLPELTEKNHETPRDILCVCAYIYACKQYMQVCMKDPSRRLKAKNSKKRKILSNHCGCYKTEHRVLPLAEAYKSLAV